MNLRILVSVENAIPDKGMGCESMKQNASANY